MKMKWQTLLRVENLFLRCRDKCSCFYSVSPSTSLSFTAYFFSLSFSHFSLSLLSLRSHFYPFSSTLSKFSHEKLPFLIIINIIAREFSQKCSFSSLNFHIFSEICWFQKPSKQHPKKTRKEKNFSTTFNWFRINASVHRSFPFCLQQNIPRFNVLWIKFMASDIER